MTPAALLAGAYEAAVDAVDGRRCVADWLHERRPDAPYHLVAVGKAAARMTDGALAVAGEQLVQGLVIQPAGTAPPRPDTRLTVIESAHPVPDERSLNAGAELVRFVTSAPVGARFLFLVSGGASSLVECLATGGDVAGLAELSRRMLADGLSIHDMNRIRRSISCIKGGRLATRLDGRRADVLLLSDVRGNDPAVIGSGLLFAPAAGPSTPADLPSAYADLVPAAPPGPAPGDASVASVHGTIIAENRTALDAASRYLLDHGIEAVIEDRFLGESVEECATDVVAAIGATPPGVARLWGGEPTVVLPSEPGNGGRMHALALRVASSLAGLSGWSLLAAGTDGADGSTGRAGAVVDGTTVKRGRVLRLSANDAIRAADSGRFLSEVGDQVPVGPTGTNVMDVVIALCGDHSPVRSRRG